MVVNGEVKEIRFIKETKLGNRFYITGTGSNELILAEELGGRVLKDGTVSVVCGTKEELIQKIKAIFNIVEEEYNPFLGKWVEEKTVEEKLNITPEVMEIIKKYNEFKLKEEKDVLNSVEKVVKYLKANFTDYSREEFRIILLDSQNQLLGIETTAIGTIDKAQIYLREIVKYIFKYNAKSIILSHNHPSGNTDPSRADGVLTKEISDFLRKIEVRTLDHIIISEYGYYSFLEEENRNL